jgi:hypothetical protein
MNQLQNEKRRMEGKRTWRVTEISGMFSKPTGASSLFELSKTIVTEARVIPACPRL